MKNGKIKIPFLPGMVFNDPEQNNFSKNQTFKIEQGTMVESKSLKSDKNKEILYREY